MLVQIKWNEIKSKSTSAERSVLRRFYFHFICLSCWMGSFYLKHFRWQLIWIPGINKWKITDKWDELAKIVHHVREISPLKWCVVRSLLFSLNIFVFGYWWCCHSRYCCVFVVSAFIVRIFLLFVHFFFFAPNTYIYSNISIRNIDTKRHSKVFSTFVFFSCISLCA